MYRIELAPGEQAIFKSIDELVTGIRGGIITPRAKIYHKASDKWLPVDYHPHYKLAKARAEAADVAPAAPPGLIQVEHLPPIPMSASATAVLEAPAATATQTAHHPGQAQELAPQGEPLAPFAGMVHANRTRSLGIVIGIVVLVGAGVAWATMRGGSAAAPADGAAQPGASAPKQTVTTLASYDTPAAAAPSAPAPGAPAANVPAPGIPAAMAPVPLTANQLAAKAAADSARAAAARAEAAKKDSVVARPILPSAPSLAGGMSLTLGESTGAGAGGDTPAALTARYNAAYEAARKELEKQLAMFGFSNIFSTSRLGAGDGVPATRTAIAAAETHLRNFRKRADAIEQAFRDSANIYAQRGNWSDTQRRQWEAASQAEGPEVQLVANTLLKATDSVFDLLASQAGQYKVSGGTITFSDPQAARQYSALRQQIAQLLGAKSANASTSVGRIVRAIGSARLPQEQ
jgi:hypothetical protein